MTDSNGAQPRITLPKSRGLEPRVLLLAETLHPDTTGGAGRVVAELAANLARLGADVRVVTRLTDRAPLPEESRNGYTIFRFSADRSSPPALYLSTRRGVQDAAARATNGWRPDLIEIHQPHIGYHALDDAMLRGIPVVYTFHSGWEDEMRVKGTWAMLAAPAAGMMERKVLRKCDVIVTLSEFMRRRATELSPNVPVTIIPGGVDLDAFPLKKSAPAGNGVVLLSVRNLVKRMGLDILIRAAEILRGRGRKFVLRIGGDGPLRAELTRQAESLGDSCVFLGHIPEADLPRHYQEADLFVLPTTAIEGFGLVILEAFASGTPVIGTPIGAIAELVGLQGHGYVSAQATAEEVAAAIAQCLDRPDRVEPGRLREIADNYSWRKRAERMLELYRHVLAAADGNKGAGGSLGTWHPTR